MSSRSLSTLTNSGEVEKGLPQLGLDKNGDGSDISLRSMSTPRKALIVGIVSWISLCTSFGSTSLFPATDMILDEFSSPPGILDVSNAVTLIFMGYSALIWGPISSNIGSRKAYNLATFLLMGFCIAIAVAPNMRVFVAMRLLAGLEGSWFMVGGQEAIASMFVPTQRGTAVGFFLAGTVIGPALGPCIGGIVVTYTSWRVIFWIQAGMTAVGLIFAVIFLPSLDSIDKVDMSKQKKVDFGSVLKSFNPCPVLNTLLVWRICLNDLTCGLLSWALYSLLVSPHLVLNEALNLNTPILGGLFYLAPGSGFLIGTIFGGRYADATVKRYLNKRGGQRIPEDRLNSALFILLGLTPVCLMTYGWSAQYGWSGIVVPAIAAFLAGFGIMAAFSGLNTYAVECTPDRRQQAVIGKYIVQYTFSAAASGATSSLIKHIGVGFTTTIAGAIFVLLGGLLTLILAKGIVSRPARTPTKAGS